MINFKELRAHRRKLENEHNHHINPLAIAAMTLFLMFALWDICFAGSVPIKDVDAVRAILGEGEAEPFIGMVALGEVIRTRGNFKGIYGYNAIKYVNGRYYRGKRAISNAIALQALKAWRASISTNYALNAQGWGSEADLRVFKKQSWFKKCHVVTKIGAHYFWNVKKGA